MSPSAHSAKCANIVAERLIKFACARVPAETKYYLWSPGGLSCVECVPRKGPWHLWRAVWRQVFPCRGLEFHTYGVLLFRMGCNNFQSICIDSWCPRAECFVSGVDEPEIYGFHIIQCARRCIMRRNLSGQVVCGWLGVFARLEMCERAFWSAMLVLCATVFPSRYGTGICARAFAHISPSPMFVPSATNRKYCVWQVVLFVRFVVWYACAHWNISIAVHWLNLKGDVYL